MPSHLYQTLILPSAVRRRRSSRLPFSSCSCSLSQHQYMSDHDGTGLWLWQVDWQWQLLLQGQTRRDIDPEYLDRLRRRRPRSSNSLIVSFARGCSPWATTCICQLQHRAVVNAAIDSLRASQSLRATIGTGSKSGLHAIFRFGLRRVFLPCPAALANCPRLLTLSTSARAPTHTHTASAHVPMRLACASAAAGSTSRRKA